MIRVLSFLSRTELCSNYLSCRSIVRHIYTHLQTLFFCFTFSGGWKLFLRLQAVWPEDQLCVCVNARPSIHFQFSFNCLTARWHNCLCWIFIFRQALSSEHLSPAGSETSHPVWEILRLILKPWTKKLMLTASVSDKWIRWHVSCRNVLSETTWLEFGKEKSFWLKIPGFITTDMAGNCPEVSVYPAVPGLQPFSFTTAALLKHNITLSSLSAVNCWPVLSAVFWEVFYHLWTQLYVNSWCVFCDLLTARHFFLQFECKTILRSAVSVSTAYSGSGPESKSALPLWESLAQANFSWLYWFDSATHTENTGPCRRISTLRGLSGFSDWCGCDVWGHWTRQFTCCLRPVMVCFFFFFFSQTRAWMLNKTLEGWNYLWTSSHLLIVLLDSSLCWLLFYLCCIVCIVLALGIWTPLRGSQRISLHESA